MKKLFSLVAIMVVALGVMIAPAMAAPTADLNKLAKYFPADAPVLVSFRTDDGYIKEIDDVIAKISAQVPDMKQPDTIAGQFDKAVKEVIGTGTFASEVRTWLGDEASIGLFSFDGMMGQADSASSNKPPHFLAAISVKDQKAAEAFWKTVLSKTTKYQSANEDGFSVFTPEDKTSDNGIVVIGKDVMFVASYKEDIPFKGQASPLSESTTFTDSIKLLPESDYNITIYTNLGDTLGKVLAMQSDMSGASASEEAMLKSIEPLLKNFPPEVVGLTVLDGRSYTVDIAVPYGDMMKQLEESGFSNLMPVPIDPAFAAKLLSGSPLVIHSTNLGPMILSTLESFQKQASMMSSSTGMSSNDIEMFGKGLDQINLGVRALTSKDLLKDILPAFQGNYALYLALNPALTDVSSPADLTKQMPIEFGFLSEVSDPTISQAIIDGVKLAFDMNKSKDAKLTSEKIGGVDSLVITGTSAEMPFPIELVVSGNDKLFFFGTRRAAEAAYNGKGGLDSDPSFKEAAQYIVPNPSAIAYLASAGLKPLSKIIGMTGSERDGQQFAALLNILSTASISSSYKDNVGYARLVWTMPQ